MKLTLTACVVASASIFTLAIGCGSGDDLFSEGNPLDSATSGGGASSSSSESSADGPTTAVAVTSSSAGGAPAATTSASGAGNSTGGEGSGAGNPGDTLDCGDGLTCPVGANSACCWDQHQQHGQPRAECVSGEPSSDDCATAYDTPPGHETRIECQSEEHCGNNEVCCARRAYSPTLGTYRYGALVCADYNDCLDPGGTDYYGLIVCDNLGSTDGCPMVQGPMGMVQGVCKPSGLLPEGYNICGTPSG